jgi:hypothetical protein
MQSSAEDVQSRYRVPLVNGIEAVLAVCGRAQGWDEDVSADFLDELMAAWERQHVPDQPVPRKDPQQLAEDICRSLTTSKGSWKRSITREVRISSSVWRRNWSVQPSFVRGICM